MSLELTRSYSLFGGLGTEANEGTKTDIAQRVSGVSLFCFGFHRPGSRQPTIERNRGDVKASPFEARFQSGNLLQEQAGILLRVGMASRQYSFSVRRVPRRWIQPDSSEVYARAPHCFSPSADGRRGRSLVSTRQLGPVPEWGSGCHPARAGDPLRRLHHGHSAKFRSTALENCSLLRRSPWPGWH